MSSLDAYLTRAPRAFKKVVDEHPEIPILIVMYSPGVGVKAPSPAARMNEAQRKKLNVTIDKVAAAAKAAGKTRADVDAFLAGYRRTHFNVSSNGRLSMAKASEFITTLETWLKDGLPQELVA